MRIKGDKITTIVAEMLFWTGLGSSMILLAVGFCLGVVEGIQGDWFGFVFAAIDFCAGGMIGVIVYDIARS